VMLSSMQAGADSIDQRVNEASTCTTFSAQRPDSPSVLSSCMSDAAAGGDDNASFCDPFSDGEEGKEEGEKTEAAAAQDTLASADPTYQYGMTACAGNTRSKPAGGHASSRILVVERDSSAFGVPHAAARPADAMPDAGTRLQDSSSRSVTKQTNNTNSFAVPDRINMTSPPEAAQLIAVSSWSEVDEIPSGGVPNESTYRHRCSCCYGANMREKYDYDCICQHSCSSSISSLGPPDMGSTDERKEEHLESGAFANAVGAASSFTRDACTSIGEGMERNYVDVHDELMNVFNTRNPEATGSNAGNWIQEDKSVTSNDSLSTIEMDFGKEGTGSAAYPTNDVPSVVRLFDSSNRTPVRLTMPAISNLTFDPPIASLTASSAVDTSNRSNNHSICRNGVSPLPQCTKQTIIEGPHRPSPKSKHVTTLSMQKADRKTLVRPDRFTTAYIPDEMVTRATSFLDVKSLLNLRVTCRAMRDISSRDEAGWVDACRRLWQEKVNICQEAIEMIESSGHRQRRKKKRRRLKGSQASSSSSGSAVRQSYGAMGAYRVSSNDARDRDVITVEELCYDFATSSSNKADSSSRYGDTGSPKRRHTSETEPHGTPQRFFPHSGHDFHGPVWSFRFKASAGPDLTTFDPWWSGEKARTMVFLRDGTVKRIVSMAELQDRATSRDGVHGAATNSQRGNHEEEEEDGRIREEDRANGYVLRPAFSDDAVARDSSSEGGVLLRRRPNIHIRWRFVSEPMDMPNRPDGAYIRLTVGNRDVPTYVVRRSPTGNWGFLLESCWGLYASFELPRNRAAMEIGSDAITQHHRGADRTHVPINAPAGARMRLRRTRYGGRWMNVNGIESDEEDEGSDRREGGSDDDGGASLLEDAAMVVTNERQWREATLYNHGAVVLPESRTGTEHFNRALRLMQV